MHSLTGSQPTNRSVYVSEESLHGPKSDTIAGFAVPVVLAAGVIILFALLIAYAWRRRLT